MHGDTLHPESRTVLQKVFQHNVRNNRRIAKQLVSAILIHDTSQMTSLFTDAVLNEALW